MIVCNDFCDTAPRIDISDNVLNNNLDFDKIRKEYEENKIVIIDDILDYNVAKNLQEYMLNVNEDDFDDYYNGYFASNSPYVELTYPISLQLQQKLKFEKYNRSWSFIYDNISNGVRLHADPSSTNVNIWVTPNESMVLDSNLNGLIVYPVAAPKDWTHDQYNGNTKKSKERCKNVNPIISKYKFNRATIFDSMFFHESQPVRSKEGHHNKRISYTWLFGEERD